MSKLIRVEISECQEIGHWNINRKLAKSLSYNPCLALFPVCQSAIFAFSMATTKRTRAMFRLFFEPSYFFRIMPATTI